MRALLVPLFLGWARAAPNASAWCRAACGFDWRSTVPLESDDVLSGCAYRDLAHYVIDHDGVVDYRAVDTTAAGAAPLAYRPREMGPLRFGGASLAGPAVAARCLPPVPIVFLALKSSTEAVAAALAFFRALARPYVLVTCNSDKPAPGELRSLLGDHNLVHWFGCHPDASARNRSGDPALAKFTAVPLGIGCDPAGHAALAPFVVGANGASGRVGGGARGARPHALFVNFHTHTWKKYRERVWRDLCEGRRAAEFTCCTPKPHTKGVDVYSKRLFERLYTAQQQHGFVAAPRGHGLDTRRLWEALLLGSVPVVERPSADELYAPFPVLLVEDFARLDRAALRARDATLGAAARDARAPWREGLRAAHWTRRIARAREDALRAAGLDAPRGGELRCWGLSADYPHARVRATTAYAKPETDAAPPRLCYAGSHKAASEPPPEGFSR